MQRLSSIEYEILNLLRAGREMYGLEMVKASKLLKRGTIYVTLDRMTQKGLVRSRQEAIEGRPGLPRRQYQITGLGARVKAADDAFAAELGSSLPDGSFA